MQPLPSDSINTPALSVTTRQEENVPGKSASPKKTSTGPPLQTSTMEAFSPHAPPGLAGLGITDVSASKLRSAKQNWQKVKGGLSAKLMTLQSLSGDEDNVQKKDVVESTGGGTKALTKLAAMIRMSQAQKAQKAQTPVLTLLADRIRAATTAKANQSSQLVKTFDIGNKAFEEAATAKGDPSAADEPTGSFSDRLVASGTESVRLFRSAVDEPSWGKFTTHAAENGFDKGKLDGLAESKKQSIFDANKTDKGFWEEAKLAKAELAQTIASDNDLFEQFVELQTKMLEFMINALETPETFQETFGEDDSATHFSEIFNSGKSTNQEAEKSERDARMDDLRSLFRKGKSAARPLAHQDAGMLIFSTMQEILHYQEGALGMQNM